MLVIDVVGNTKQYLQHRLNNVTTCIYAVC